MCHRIFYLLENTNDLINLNKSLRNLKEEYSLNDRQVEGVLSAFDTLGISPVTRTMRSIIKGSESLLMILRISFCGKDHTAICAGA